MLEDQKEQTDWRDMRDELRALHIDNDTAIEALGEIERRLQLLRDIADWRRISGSFLNMGTIPGSLELVMSAMQKDILAYTRKTLAGFCDDELPF